MPAMPRMLRLVRSGARALLRWILRLAGLYVLVRSAVAAYGGVDKVWRFTEHEQHRFTAMSMLTGSLHLRDAVTQVQGDEQVFNGAVYTNWGFGVPLLELPFQAFSRWSHALHTIFFPDRAIYFGYLCVVIPAFWFSIDRMLARRLAPDRSVIIRNILSCAATFLVLAYALYPVSCCRFQIYEETICYAILFQILSIGAYLVALDSESVVPTAVLGLAAGIGLVLRPTGLIYFAMWAGLVVLRKRRVRSVVAFAGAAAPLVLFWTISNRVRTGTVTGAGFSNALPYYPFHTAMMRFGSHCTDTIAHTLQLAKQLFVLLFVRATEEMTPHLQKCHFESEGRVFPEHLTEPAMGLTVPLLLVAIVLFSWRRNRWLSLLVPVATFGTIFASYVYAGAGFAWRYFGDFSPVLVLAFLQFVHDLPLRYDGLLGLRSALLCSALGVGLYWRDVSPYASTISAMDNQRVAEIPVAYLRARGGPEPALPSRLMCRGVSEPPYHNGQGWSSDCSVDVSTNIFLGVAQKATHAYKLRFRVDGAVEPELRVYVNGRNYVAHPRDEAYEADVEIDYAKLTSPTVMATVEWTRGLDAPAGVKMEWVELV